MNARLMPELALPARFHEFASNCLQPHDMFLPVKRINVPAPMAIPRPLSKTMKDAKQRARRCRRLGNCRKSSMLLNGKCSAPKYRANAVSKDLLARCSLKAKLIDAQVHDF